MVMVLMLVLLLLMLVLANVQALANANYRLWVGVLLMLEDRWRMMDSSSYSTGGIRAADTWHGVMLLLLMVVEVRIARPQRSWRIHEGSCWHGDDVGATLISSAARSCIGPPAPVPLVLLQMLILARMVMVVLLLVG